VIQTSGETLPAIINDILGMSSLEAGRFKLHNRPFEPRTVVREVRGRQRAGLGLAICKHLVDATGGEIDVRSKMHNGSIFTVRVPATVAQAAASGEEARQRPRRAAATFATADR